ncbi:MAG TPA: hypothetical protein VNF68_15170 [Candidatus Baltobacteraceae bacterium]|nr:hypothetical protein [Candidatus Baltobacteraceae bacterium]
MTVFSDIGAVASSAALAAKLNAVKQIIAALSMHIRDFQGVRKLSDLPWAAALLSILARGARFCGRCLFPTVAHTEKPCRFNAQRKG